MEGGRENENGKMAEEETSGRYRAKDPERLTLNLAYMLEEAGKIAGAWARAREAGEPGAPMSGPVNDMMKTFSQLADYWKADQKRMVEAQTKLFSAYLDIWPNSIKRLGGEAEDEAAKIKPDPRDRRFRDADWDSHPFFDLLKQVYLVTARWADEMVEQPAALDEDLRAKARFYVRQVMDALSPSNFFLTNPEVLRETFATNGENLVRGMKMLAEDIADGQGRLRLRQTDASKFKLGKNIAVTPGKVVARNELAEIIQYEPVTETVFHRPLLIIPPWINKFYVLDLSAERSFVRWAVEQGHTVFMVSWVNPDKSHSHLGWEDYASLGIDFALRTVEECTGEKDINVVGYCIGGTLLAAALGAMAQEGDERVVSATLMASQVDFTHAGELKLFADEDQIAALEQAMEARGFLEGSAMASVFNMLRARDLIWPYMVNNYLLGKEPLPFDLLYWNSDSTRMTPTNHSYYLRTFYLENGLASGRASLRGKVISLKDVKTPVYCVSASDDHISPARSVFEGAKLFGGPVELVMGSSGHIAGIVNPPAAGKYEYRTAPVDVESFEEWRAKGEPIKGSWWPHWQAWLEAQDSERVPARKLDKTEAYLGDAPGSYVHVRG